MTKECVHSKMASWHLIMFILGIGLTTPSFYWATCSFFFSFDIGQSKHSIVCPSCIFSYCLPFVILFFLLCLFYWGLQYYLFVIKMNILVRSFWELCYTLVLYYPLISESWEMLSISMVAFAWGRTDWFRLSAMFRLLYMWYIVSKLKSLSDMCFLYLVLHMFLP